MGLPLALQGTPPVQGEGEGRPPSHVLLSAASEPGVMIITESLGDGHQIFTSLSGKTN